MEGSTSFNKRGYRYTYSGEINICFCLFLFFLFYYFLSFLLSIFHITYFHCRLIMLVKQPTYMIPVISSKGVPMSFRNILVIHGCGIVCELAVVLMEVFVILILIQVKHLFYCTAFTFDCQYQVFYIWISLYRGILLFILQGSKFVEDT